MSVLRRYDFSCRRHPRTRFEGLEPRRRGVLVVFRGGGPTQRGVHQFSNGVSHSGAGPEASPRRRPPASRARCKPVARTRRRAGYRTGVLQQFAGQRYDGLHTAAAGSAFASSRQNRPSSRSVATRPFGRYIDHSSSCRRPAGISGASISKVQPPRNVSVVVASGRTMIPCTTQPTSVSSSRRLSPHSTCQLPPVIHRCQVPCTLTPGFPRVEATAADVPTSRSAVMAGRR